MKLRRTLASVLTVCMLVTLSGMTAFAIDTSANTNAEISAIETLENDKKKAFEYVYIDEEVVNIPQEQNIAVAFADADLILESATLYCKSVDTQVIHELYAENIVDNTVLFQKQYTDIAEMGMYELHSIAYKIAGEDESITVEFLEQDIDAFYTVTDGTEEWTENEAVSGRQKSELAEVTVYSLDGTGNTIEETTQNTSDAEIAVADVLEQADDEGILQSNARAKKDNLVVVICPGHDATHTGATGHGLKEQELTFKIATYCKEELEKYAGVTVYMSRDSIECSYPGKSTSYCLNQRPKDAHEMGADVFVDVHINAGGGAGAEVYYPNNSYSSAIHKDGKELAEQIVAQLEALGLKNRGAKTKDCTDNTKDENGKLADYFTSIANSKEYGMVGLIIEHAFIDNASDAAKLSSESFLKNMGIADATGIAKAYGLTKGVNTNTGTGTGNGSETGTGVGTGSEVKLPFTDVNKDAWYYEAIKSVYTDKIMTGINPTTFGVSDDLTRSQFAVILYRLSGEKSSGYTNKFPDVPNGEWYTDAIMWASNAGIVTGYEYGYFGVADSITREQMATMLLRYTKYMGKDTSCRVSLKNYADAWKVTDYAEEAMQWAVGTTIITGRNNGALLAPEGNTNRAECATIITRYKNQLMN